MLAAFGLATIPSRLLGGRLSDRWGTRTTIVGGLVRRRSRSCSSPASQTLTQARSRWCCSGWPSRSTSHRASRWWPTPPRRRTAPVAFGLLAAALAAAGMGAGLLAAVLAGVRPAVAVRGRRGDLPGVRGLVRWRLPGRATAGPWSRGRPARPWRDRRLLVLLGLGTGFAVVYLQITITLPLTVTARGLSPSVVGLLLTVSAATIVLAQPVLAPPWLRRLDDTAALALGPPRARGRSRAHRAGDQPGVVRRRDGRVEPRRPRAARSRLHPGVGDRPRDAAAARTSPRSAPAGASPPSSPRSSAPSCSTARAPPTWSSLAGVCVALAAAYLRARGSLAARYLQSLTSAAVAFSADASSACTRTARSCSAAGGPSAATSTCWWWSSAR